MPFAITISDMPFCDDTPQEEIERRRADRMARKASRSTKKRIANGKKREKKLEKKMFPNLTGEFDTDCPFAKHFTGKRDQ
jgi:hypothetical protein